MYAIRMLMDIYVNGPSYQALIFSIGCLEILYNPGRYGLNLQNYDCTSLRDWCLELVDNFNHQYLFPKFVNWAGAETISYEPNLLVTAIGQVYGIVMASTSHYPSPKYLSEPLYYILAKTTLVIPTNAQRVFYAALLSNFAFPRFIPDLSRGTDLDMFEPYMMTRYDQTLIWQMGYTFRKGPSSQARHFAATQLWILLFLIDDLLPEYYEPVKSVIESKTRLQIQAKGLDQVRRDLETYIIKGYREQCPEGNGGIARMIRSCIPLYKFGALGGIQLQVRVKTINIFHDNHRLDS
ncbi:hypothetical protein B0J17DRAFT_207737 [Rhizoctonia solani]|nr:hypothetical protein B0J17DRAFT_207737 [Rhizoctonia solani]